LTKQFLEKLQDTQLLVGSESYASVLTVYKLFGSAANAGVAGTDSIVSQLKQRFAGQGRSGIPATPVASK
jgi:hypothetical protein